LLHSRFLLFDSAASQNAGDGYRVCTKPAAYAKENRCKTARSKEFRKCWKARSKTGSKSSFAGSQGPKPTFAGTASNAASAPDASSSYSDADSGTKTYSYTDSKPESETIAVTTAGAFSEPFSFTVAASIADAFAITFTVACSNGAPDGIAQSVCTPIGSSLAKPIAESGTNEFRQERVSDILRIA
jgi:hypothetical protein